MLLDPDKIFSVAFSNFGCFFIWCGFSISKNCKSKFPVGCQASYFPNKGSTKCTQCPRLWRGRRARACKATLRYFLPTGTVGYSNVKIGSPVVSPERERGAGRAAWALLRPGPRSPHRSLSPQGPLFQPPGPNLRTGKRNHRKPVKGVFPQQGLLGTEPPGRGFPARG